MQEVPSMGELHFPDLTIKGFRGIRDLTIPKLGRVTLITGKNNTGKSSILEALYLHTHNALPLLVHEILKFREESVWSSDIEGRAPNPDSLFQVVALFHGFPRLSEEFDPIVISTSGRVQNATLSMRIDWLPDRSDRYDPRSLDPRQRRLIQDPGIEHHDLRGDDLVAALVVETEEGRIIHRLDDFLRRAPYRFRRLGVEERMPCKLVGPYSGEQTNSLDHLWTTIALTDRERDVVEALKIIDPRISDVSIVAGQAQAEARTAIVRTEDLPRPVPLRSFGDGVNRLFATVLSLVNAGGGALLVDEFENGLHYTVLLDAWRMVFKLARALDVQVFATSHSWDAVEAFQQAAAESPEEGVLLRLTRRGGAVIPTTFAEDELAVATRAMIEVR